MKCPLLAHQNVIGHFKIGHCRPVGAFQITIGIKVGNHLGIILRYPVKVIINGKVSGIVEGPPHASLARTAIFVSTIFPATVLMPVFAAVNAVRIRIFPVCALQLAPYEVFFVVFQRGDFFPVGIDDILFTHIDRLAVGRVVRTTHHELFPQVSQVVGRKQLGFLHIPKAIKPIVPLGRVAMLLPSDNETCPLFNQGLQGFRHKEVEETDPIFSVTYRYQVLSQTGETKLIQICISCLLSKAGDLHLRRIFRCQSGNGQLGP